MIVGNSRYYWTPTDCSSRSRNALPHGEAVRAGIDLKGP